MVPRIPERSNDEWSILCEMSVKAAEEALARAGKTAADIDGVIVACSNLQRAYPAIAIEVQAALGIRGFGFDMNVACSSATFGIQNAVNSIKLGQARAILMVNPEICTGHMNFRDRDSHFIFGDACTAVVIEREDLATSAHQWEVLSTKLVTEFSNNIRNNFGFLNRTAEEYMSNPDKLFIQEGRKVFKEVCPMVAELIGEHLSENGIAVESVKRFWLHQANLNMNHLIVRKLLGRDATEEEAPVILDTYANTSSAGSVIAFHKHQDDLPSGSLGVLSSFGRLLDRQRDPAQALIAERAVRRLCCNPAMAISRSAHAFAAARRSCRCCARATVGVTGRGLRTSRPCPLGPVHPHPAH